MAYDRSSTSSACERGKRERGLVRHRALQLLIACAVAPALPIGATAASLGMPIHAFERAVPSLVLPAQYVGGSAELPSHLRWLVVASRPSYAEAVGYAQRFSEFVAPSVVVESQNGWYAVLAGVLDMPKAERNLVNLKGARLVPQDAFLSNGRNFHTIVWTGYASGTTHDVMDQRAVRRTVRRMQTALSEIGIYRGAIDGLLGRKTVRAFQRFEKEHGRRIYGEDRLGPNEIARLETTSRQVAVSRTRERERQRLATERRRDEERRAKFAARQAEAARGGFDTVDEMLEARAAGFEDASTYRDARRARIPTADEYGAFVASRFEDADDWRDARSRGFATPEKLAAADRGGWRSKDEMTAGLRLGYGGGDDYRTAQAGGFETAAQYAEAKRGGFRRLENFLHARERDYRTREEMIAAKRGGFETGEAFRDAKGRGFDTASERDEAGKAGFRLARDWRAARANGFATRAERDETTALGFETADARRKAEERGFTTAAAYDGAVRAGWRDVAEMEAGTELGYARGEAYRAGTKGGFENARSYAAAAARGLKTQRAVVEADRLGYRTASAMEAGKRGLFADAGEYREAAKGGFATRADWVRAGLGGFGTAADLEAADAGGYADMAELERGRDGGFENAAQMREARDRGYATLVAFERGTREGYADADEMARGHRGGFADAKGYRAAAALGFGGKSEMERARRAGFRDAAQRDAAAERGFATLAALEAAERDGFGTAAMHAAYLNSGFEAPADFKRAHAAGHASLMDALADARERLQASRERSEELLADTDLYMRVAPAGALDPVALIALVGALKSGLETASPEADFPTLEATIAALDGDGRRLAQVLGRVDGFVAFRAKRQGERRDARVAELAETRERLIAVRDAGEAWIARNLLHEAAGEVAARVAAAREALEADELEPMSRASSELMDVARKWDVALAVGSPLIGVLADGSGNETANDGGTLPSNVSSGGADPIAVSALGSALGSVGEAATAPAPSTFAVTEANRFLLEGAPDGVVALFQLGADEARARYSIVGDVVFRDGSARICALGLPTEGADGRSLRTALAGVGVTDGGAIETCAADALNETDLVLLRRDAFLLANTDLAGAVLDGVETHRLRHLPALNERALGAVRDRENALVAAIGADLEAGGRGGYGAVTLVDAARASLCMVVGAGDASLHHAVLRERSGLPIGDAPPAPVTLDGAYGLAQRGECGTIYASGDQLAKLMPALSRASLDHAIEPFWVAPDAVAAERARVERASLARTQGVEDRRREREAREALRARRDAERAATATMRTQALREEHGPRAREMQQAAIELLAPVLAPRPAGPGARLFGTLAAWSHDRHEDYWTIEDVTHEIADFGMVDWRGRRVEAVLLRVEPRLVNRDRGERRTECFLLGVVWDGEFDRWRDPVETPCADAGPIESWRTGHAMESLWLASAR